MHGIFLKDRKNRDFTMSAAASPENAAGPTNTLTSRVRVVMVETSHPGNVGSAARAMKTMGLTDLVLVAPKETNVTGHANAQALASGATDVLAQARIVPTLKEAIADTRFAIAFTARRRELSHPFVPLREAVSVARQQLLEGPHDRVALVFGNEAMCLSNEDVDQCQLTSAIPANAEYSSLNVSQSIQVAAYEVMMQLGQFDVTDHAERPAASVGDVERLLTHLETAAVESGFLDPQSPKKFVTRMHRLFTRARMEPEEVAILRGLLSQFQNRMRHK
jgi:tRNA/rRNA methyltransferase